MALDLNGTNKVVFDNLNQNIKDLLFPKNWIINGGFDVWQRGTSQTTNGYGSDDRWSNENAISTKTHSRQAFAVGQTEVQNNPTYFSRTVATTGGTAGSYVSKEQKIEDVAKLAGKTVSISFWAKADANKNMSFQLGQYFGVGGSVSVYNIGLQKIALTTVWQRFTKTVTIPLISGKTVGANNATLLWFLFDAGADLNSYSDNLGNQSGTFDIANVSLVEGSTPVEWQTEAYADVLDKCQDYYETGLIPDPLGYYTGSFFLFNSLSFKKRKRVNPTLTITAESGAYMVVAGNYAVEAVNNAGWGGNATQHVFSFRKSKQGTGNATPTVASVYNWQGNVIYTADSEL